MTNEIFTVCPYCREPVDREAPGVVFAVEQVDVPGMGQAHGLVDA